jgi:hypothetical protein
MKHPRKIHGSFQPWWNTDHCPEEPSHRNTFATVTEAKDYYRRQALQFGCIMLADEFGCIMLADGSGPACWVDLFDANEWDGVSYGDPYARLVFTTPRLTIRTEPY